MGGKDSVFSKQVELEVETVRRCTFKVKISEAVSHERSQPRAALVGGDSKNKRTAAARECIPNVSLVIVCLYLPVDGPGGLTKGGTKGDGGDDSFLRCMFVVESVVPA